MQEPLEVYLEAFDRYRDAVDNLLEITADLSKIQEFAVEVLSEPDLLYAVRYLAGPPMSKDDLRVLAEASIAPRRLATDPEMARRVVETVFLGLDRSRFPWVAEDREPSESEREAAAIASAALIASQRAGTHRRNESKLAQEGAVKDHLRALGLSEVRARDIRTLDDAPARGQFCGESSFGGRKADIVVRLWDARVMPIECKVSNSATNSIKRLNNDAARKAEEWLTQFGTAQTLPAAVLSGVYNVHNVTYAQDRGLIIFWAHSLCALADFLEATRTA